jgi:hypothetical protein
MMALNRDWCQNSTAETTIIDSHPTMRYETINRLIGDGIDVFPKGFPNDVAL